MTTCRIVGILLQLTGETPELLDAAPCIEPIKSSVQGMDVAVIITKLPQPGNLLEHIVSQCHFGLTPPPMRYTV